MNEWTQGASEYLEGYLAQVDALARNQQDDADEIVGNLRDYIVQETEREAGSGMITLEDVRRVTSRLGPPEGVLEVDLPPALAARSADTPTVSAAPPPPPLPPVMPRAAARQGASSNTGCIVAAVIVPVVALFMIMVMGILAAILLPALGRAREAAQRASCANNLKQLGLAINMHYNDHNALPAVHPEPGTLTFDPQTMLEYLPDSEVLHCPSQAWDLHEDTASYLYLGYIVANQEDMDAYVAAYRAALAAPGDFRAALEREAGALLPLTHANLRTRGLAASEVPAFVERAGNHYPDGANVTFLDGHVQYIRMGEKWPVTEAFYRSIAMLE